jgi:thiamine-monophosphate kinase
MLNQIIENYSIETLARVFTRAPYQQNKLHQSDAELIRLPGTEITLALTMDSIVEEIETGLYSDPYLIGWMIVMANASDLAAVGARPLGILINETFSKDIAGSAKDKIQNGIEAACFNSGMYVLGGDTNISTQMEMTGCAVGYIDTGDPVTRKGCKAGDILYISDRMGAGNAFAVKQLYLSDSQKCSSNYLPQSRIIEGQTLARFATSCMDTSDGFFAALDQLKRINHSGFRLEYPLDSFIHPLAYNCCKSLNLPLWLMLAGHHGEYELVFTIAKENEDSFLQAADRINWKPVRIGYVQEELTISMLDNEDTVSVDTAGVRNIFAENPGGNVQDYIIKLLNLGKTFNRRKL